VIVKLGVQNYEKITEGVGKQGAEWVEERILWKKIT